MDFGTLFVLSEHINSVPKNQICQICNEIGMIMEDASVVALIWAEDGGVSIAEQLQMLPHGQTRSSTRIARGFKLAAESLETLLVLKFRSQAHRDDCGQ